MKERRSLAHTKWECKYHVVILPEYRKKILYGQMAEETDRRNFKRAMLLQRHRNLRSKIYLALILLYIFPFVA